MNSLLILPSECTQSELATLRGERARYAIDTHGVVEGQPIKIAVLNQGRGEGKILRVTQDLVEVSFTLTLSAIAPVPLSLIVGVPRPQTVKKVVQAAVMFGAQELHFVKSELGEKSYLQSRSLHEDQLQEETIKALEQIWDSRAPSITIHRSLQYFLNNKVGELISQAQETPQCLIAHPGGTPLTHVGKRAGSPPSTIIAIGPERGWSEDEVLAFERIGFHRIGLGERVVRVELALVYLLGQLSAL